MFFLISGLILMSYITVTFCKTTSSKTLFSYWWKLDGEIRFLSGTWQCKLHSEHYYITLINVVHINKIYILTLYSGYFGKNPGILGSRYHGSACPTPFPITAHTLTWSHLSLIEHTCNHSPLPFISSLTSVTRRLVSRSQGCMYAALYTGHCLPVCLSARLSWIWSPPEETQVYVQCDCTSGFQRLLCYISYVGSPAWVILNKPPFTIICLSVSLTSAWQ